MRALILVATAALLTACGTQSNLSLETAVVQGENGPVTFLRQPGNLTPDKIIGENDLVKVNANGSNIPEKYSSLLNAFGRMSMGCSATHIGNGIVLSAGHCFDAEMYREDNVPCANVTVAWGVRSGQPAYLTSKCVKILSQQRDEQVDYAIFQVSPAPKARVELELRGKPVVGASLTIFGHPQGRPLEWSQTCSFQRTPQSVPFNEADFVHQCDTEPGNSGSTILDDRTLRVIGIHDGGISPWNYGTLLLNTPIKEYMRLTLEEPNAEGSEESVTLVTNH